MISRRNFLGIAAGAGASLALTPKLLRALQRSGVSVDELLNAPLIQRAIPSSGELLPAVGLSFSNHPGCADHAALTEVLKMFGDGGGRVFDVMHVNPDSEDFHINAARELGIQNKLFWSTRGTAGNAAPQPGAAFVKEHIDSLLAKIKVPKLDLVMLPVAADPTNLAALKEEKKAGRVRYIGVQSISANMQSARLLEIMRSEPIDFIGVDYDISNRGVEETILPLALERKIGVMAFFPFNNAGGLSCTGGTSLFSRVATTDLPTWAADFDAKSWAQYFTKYVISHPAVTVARIGTTKVNHMLDDLAGGLGRLPDEAMRTRMKLFIDALPAAPPLGAKPPQQAPVIMLSAAVLDRYVGNYKTTTGTVLAVRRYGTTLVAKAGKDPEIVLIARSETRFTLGGRGTDTIEFQPDSGGKVTALIYEQGSQKTPATRIR
jgi:aryl-alcohol dehydrogenase-like predicted oxidoreductase